MSYSLRIVIPPPVKRARAVISARVGWRDLVFSFDGLRVFIKPRLGFLKKFWIAEESQRRDAACRVSIADSPSRREHHDLLFCHPDRSRSDDWSEASGGIPTMRIAPCRLREFSRESIFPDGSNKRLHSRQILFICGLRKKLRLTKQIRRLIMQALNRQSEHLRAGANYHLLGAMRRVEERDRDKFSQPPND